MFYNYDTQFMCPNKAHDLYGFLCKEVYLSWHVLHDNRENEYWGRKSNLLS